MAYPGKSNKFSGNPGKNRQASNYTILTLEALFSQFYLPYARIRKRSWQLDERLFRKHLSAAFGALRLNQINRQDVEDWLNKLLEAGFAPSTCNRILAVLKTVCNFAEIHGYLPHDQSPCRGISSFKTPYQKVRYLSQSEAVRLMEVLEKDGRPSARAIQLLLLTGARKNEILKARWEHVNLEQRLIIVPLSKSGKPRYIVLSRLAMSIIRKIPRTAGSPWLFAGNIPNRPLADLYDYWQKLRCRLGLQDVRIHDLRHTFASFLVNNGHSLYEVQKLLGHADPRTTMRYAHLQQDSLVAATEKVGGFFAKSRDRRKATGQDAD